MSDGIAEGVYQPPEYDELAFLHYERSFRAPLEKRWLSCKRGTTTSIGTRITHLCRPTSTHILRQARGLARWGTPFRPACAVSANANESGTRSGSVVTRHGDGQVMPCGIPNDRRGYT